VGGGAAPERTVEAATIDGAGSRRAPRGYRGRSTALARPGSGWSERATGRGGCCGAGGHGEGHDGAGGHGEGRGRRRQKISAV
jgi:hypothetical protein